MTPTYINILNVYAFCNTHDITWGTKGDDKAEKLPSANIKPGGKVDVNIPQDDGDLNAQYDAEMRKIATKPPKEVKVVSDQERQEDYYKGFRSSVVLVWMFCNFALAAVVLSTAGVERIEVNNSDTQRATIYMAVVLWSVAGLSAFRFIGAIWFLVVRLVRFPSHSPDPALTGADMVCAAVPWGMIMATAVWGASLGNMGERGLVWNTLCYLAAMNRAFNASGTALTRHCASYLLRLSFCRSLSPSPS